MTKLRALVVVAVVAGVAAAAAPASAIGPLRHEKVRATVAGDVTSLIVRNEVGDIEIVPGSTTSIVADESYNLAAPHFTHTLSDGALQVSAPCPSAGTVDLGLNDCSVDLVITVPRVVSVDVVDEVGSVVVAGLQGKETIRTDVGRVVLRRVSASTLSAVSSAGTVLLDHVSARALTLRSDTGGIRASLAAAPRAVVARAADGDVALTVPSGTYALRLHSDVGATHVTGITARPDAPRSITASSDDGDVRIVGTPTA